MSLACHRPTRAIARCRPSSLCLLAAMLGLALGVGSAGAADPDLPPGQVAVLDAGTFVVVEANQAALGVVLDQIKTRLGIEISDTDRIDLSRIVTGRRIGTVFEIIRWLTPSANFVLLYEERRPGDTTQPRLERIGFLRAGGGSAGVDPGPPSSAPSATAAASRRASTAGADEPAGRPVDTGRVVAPAGDAGVAEAPEVRTDGSKPDLPYTAKREIKSVAEQLAAATPEAQLAIERQAHAANPQ